MRPDEKRHKGGVHHRLFLLWLSIVTACSLFLRWLLRLGEERRQRERKEVQRQAELMARKRPVRYPPPHIHYADQWVRVRLGERAAVLVLFLGAALVVAVVILLAVWGSLSWITGAPFLGNPGERSVQESAGAELPLPPAGQQAQRRATQEASLNQYAWVDREAGIAQIPVERAIEIVVEQGGSPLERTPRATVAATPSVTETVMATPISSAQAEDTMVSAGEALFQSRGCVDCHRPDDRGLAPNLNGVFGSQVSLKSGETVEADGAYIRRSILEPHAQVVEGFRALMPSFSGRLSEQELEQLVAYIRSIGRE